MSIEYDTRRFTPGEVIFKEGESSDGFYVLQSGRVEIIVTGPTGASVSLAYVEEGDSFGEMSIVDGTNRTATAIAAEDSTLMFFRRETLEGELKRAELITFLFRNVCRKLAEQNREVSQHSYSDLQPGLAAESTYQSTLTLEPISARMEKFMGPKRLNISQLPFPVGNTAQPGGPARTDHGLWIKVDRMKDFMAPHFQFIRHDNQFFVADLSGSPGTTVNDRVCNAGGAAPSVPLRRGFNQIKLPSHGADFGFLAYVR